MENETLPISEDLLEEEEDVAECAPCEQTSPTKKTHNVFTETMKMLNMVPVMVEVGSPKGLVVRTAPTDLCIPVPPEIKVELRARAIVKVPLGLRFRVPEGFCVRLCTNNEACTRGVICLSDIVETTEFMPISATVMNVSDTPVEFFCNDIICDVIVWPIRAVKLKVLGQGEFDDEWNKRMESEKKAKSKAVEAVRAAEEAASADAAM